MSSSLQLHKKGLRVLGVAESFVKGEKESVLAGVVMRADLLIDGFSFSRIRVGGMDATDGVLRIFNKLGRRDINAIFLNGCVISWFNIIDLHRVYDATGLPVLCVTYEESEGLEKYLREYFDDCEERIRAYKSLGEREKLVLHTGHEVLVRYLGVETGDDARALLGKFTHQGAIPEPLRVSRLLARAILRDER
jgi:hypothetical protein